MKTIVSKDNPVLKKAQKLLTRKGREEAGSFLVEGRKLISEAASAGFRIENVFVDSGALQCGEAAEGEYENEIALEEKLFRNLARTVNPQPYIAVVRRPGLTEDCRREGAESAAQFPAPGPVLGGERVLILDRISDPGNAGTMIRTALAAGMSSVWCLKGTADAFSDKAIRASAGAVFHIPLVEGLDAADCIDRARRMGARLFVCNAGGENVYNKTFAGRFAVVVGSESAGVQEAFLDAADEVAGIPMAEAAESLNAATAAAVVMYEALRQRTV